MPVVPVAITQGRQAGGGRCTSNFQRWGYREVYIYGRASFTQVQRSDSLEAQGGTPCLVPTMLMFVGDALRVRLCLNLPLRANPAS